MGNKAVSRPGCISVSPISPSAHMLHHLAGLMIYIANLQDRVVNCQKTENDGIPASNNERSDSRRAIMYAILRVMKAHKRRD